MYLTLIHISALLTSTSSNKHFALHIKVLHIRFDGSFPGSNHPLDFNIHLGQITIFPFLNNNGCYTETKINDLLIQLEKHGGKKKEKFLQ